MPYLFIVKNSSDCEEFIKKFSINEGHSIELVDAKHDCSNDPLIKKLFITAATANLIPVLVGFYDCIPLSINGRSMGPDDAIKLLKSPDAPISDLVSSTHQSLRRCGITHIV